MNRNVTASFSLSVSLVVLFAVLLYQPDGPVSPPPQPSTVARADVAQPIPDLVGDRPRLTPGIPLTGSSAGHETSERPSPSPAVGGEVVVHEAVREESRPSPGGQAGGPRPGPAPALPPSAFTHARPGESLVDIAVRVYGSPESARKIWMANRDLIDSIDAIPRGGTLLRTP
jgi:hypothetical protein